MLRTRAFYEQNKTSSYVCGTIRLGLFDLRNSNFVNGNLGPAMSFALFWHFLSEAMDDYSGVWIGS